MDVIARECDTWFVNYEKDHNRYEESLMRIEREIAIMESRVHALNRKMKYGINAIVFLGETDDEGREKLEEHLEHARSDPSMLVGTSGVGAALYGSSSTVIDRIRRSEGLGIDLLMLHFYPMKQGLEEFAERIMPEFKPIDGK